MKWNDLPRRHRGFLKTLGGHSGVIEFQVGRGVPGTELVVTPHDIGLLRQYVLANLSEFSIAGVADDSLMLKFRPDNVTTGQVGEGDEA